MDGERKKKEGRRKEEKETYLRFSQQAEQLTTFDEIHNHVQVLRILECSPQGDKERVFDLLQHAALVIGVFDLLHLDHLGLLEHFDSIEALVVLGLDQVYTTKTAGAEGPTDCEVIEGVFALGLSHGVGDWLARQSRSSAIGGVPRVLLRRGIDQILDAGCVLRGLL